MIYFVYLCTLLFKLFKQKMTTSLRNKKRLMKTNNLYNQSVFGQDSKYSFAFNLPGKRTKLDSEQTVTFNSFF